jgi:hypothetical protein
MDGRTGDRGQVTRRRRLVSPTTAVMLGVLSTLVLAGNYVLQALSHEFSSSASGLADAATLATYVLAFTVVGVVVVRHDPRNPIGWMLIGVALAVPTANDGSTYAYLDYTLHHGTLPLGHVALLSSFGWIAALALVPLIVLHFPDGRPGSRWRLPLRAYLAVVALAIAGTVGATVSDFALRMPLDANGNVVGVQPPSGATAWLAPIEFVLGLSLVGFVIGAVAFQLRRYRRASGERRQQLQWLAAGAAVCIVGLATTKILSSGSAIGGITFCVGLAALPLGIGIGIRRYRLYEIDRLVSRTLSYAILTALLAGMFIGLIALTTNTLALSGRVGVATSPLAAAALFNPLRIRIQRLVDRRFNRTRYDAEATVAAFTARLRDAVEIDAIRADLLDAVNRAVQPAHVSVWIKQ